MTRPTRRTAMAAVLVQEDSVDHEWGGQWPIEEVWVAKRRIDP